MRVLTVSPPLALAVGTGLVVAASGPWRTGLIVAGTALALAGVLRAVMPAGRLGLLVVRSRLVDVTGLLVAGGLLIVGGVWFLLAAHRLDRAVHRDEVVNSMRLFHLSNTYLTGLFVAVAVDSAFGWPALGWPF